ncbi:Gfo/Idh/MocA family protein [Halovivax sp.]|uniref:Gfo/Idh/MocA family protein n=1 Tax=Halovivax sp. TaxID=1935978 RepID=UPI0025C4EA95|nr:Gfo/Idh/MocA family oxidoreductase [Halovivax sp.]
MRFGILSTAGIARKSMIPAIAESDHELVAVASRNEEIARAFADDFDVEILETYGSYEALFDADVDAVYNPLPNALHAEWTRRAADAGLHVLCEKPMTVDADEARAVFDYCEDAGVTVMEAFMYQFHPITDRTREIAANALSTIRNVRSQFTFSLADLDDIRVSPDLAGGSLMDVGCYPVSGIRGFLGEPRRVSAHALDTTDVGVDTEMAARLEYDDAHAQFLCGFDTPHRQSLRVEAENGWLEAEDVYNPGTSDVELTYSVDGQREMETIEGVDPYRLEVEAFADAVESGDEPPIDRDETIANMRVIDALYESADRSESVTVSD